MLVSTTWNLGHRVIETRGEVFGLVVRTRSLPMNFVAGIRSSSGGEIEVSTELLESSRRQAVDRTAAKSPTTRVNAVIETDPSEMRVPATPARTAGAGASG